jgi:hypothetical protein
MSVMAVTRQPGLPASSVTCWRAFSFLEAGRMGTSKTDVAKADGGQEGNGANATPTLAERIALGPRLSAEIRLNRALEHLTYLEMELGEHEEELCEILDLEELHGAIWDIRNAINAVTTDDLPIIQIIANQATAEEKVSAA